MNLIFFGIQGSGKGTQSKLLAERLNYTVFETGAELRKLAKENSELGIKVKTTIEAGLLVSAELVLEILKNFIKNHTKTNNSKIIFDGIPRNEAQAIEFRKILNEYGLDYKAVHFALSKEEAMTRLFKRAQIENRADDNEASIKKRIDIFFNDTLPIINTFKLENKLIEIDASPSVEEIYQNLSKLI